MVTYKLIKNFSKGDFLDQLNVITRNKHVGQYNNIIYHIICNAIVCMFKLITQSRLKTLLPSLMERRLVLVVHQIP